MAHNDMMKYHYQFTYMIGILEMVYQDVTSVGWLGARGQTKSFPHLVTTCRLQKKHSANFTTFTFLLTDMDKPCACHTFMKG